jgi:hypothetical protein
MTRYSAALTVRALCELALYDVTNACFGFGGVCKRLVRGCRESGRRRSKSPEHIFDAVNLAACLYFKQVHCWERSVVTVRLLRKYCIPCRLVIGYRPSPFFSHAWVEIDGRLVNDLPGYAEQLRVLHKL